MAQEKIKVGQTVKLSPKQREVILKMREGWVMITSDSSRDGLLAGVNKGETKIVRSRVFWNLVYKDLIYQELRRPFDYVLTPLGKSIEI